VGRQRFGTEQDSTSGSEEAVHSEYAVSRKYRDPLPLRVLTLYSPDLSIIVLDHCRCTASSYYHSLAVTSSPPSNQSYSLRYIHGLFSTVCALSLPIRHAYPLSTLSIHCLFTVCSSRSLFNSKLSPALPLHCHFTVGTVNSRSTNSSHFGFTLHSLRHPSIHRTRCF
jgi:hypothetical protein